jgi:transcriptional regulator with XRE-family HTH domain
MRKATKTRLLKEMGREIRERRRSRGLRQRDLAKALTTTIPAASLIEGGHRDLRITELATIAELLGARLVDLVPSLDHEGSVPRTAR